MELWRALTEEFPASEPALVVGVRLVLAAILGGALGLERELSGKPAGLRTHMLVTLGAALFVIGMAEAGGSASDVSRVVQGVATGIGFVGAGAILKAESTTHVTGLTTAASIWLTAGVGVAVGAGRIWVPVVGVALALCILAGIGWLEAALGHRTLRGSQWRYPHGAPPPDGPPSR